MEKICEKEQTFLITVTILEGRHYIWPNMDSAIIVKVDNKKRCTAVRYESDCPFYNEYFVYEFFTTFQKIIEKTITFTVIQPRTVCRKRKILGYFALDVATVWGQKNNQFCHKWAILSSPKVDVYGGPQGYIKVDISILAKGQSPKLPPHITNDEIEGNLLMPEGPNNDRQKASYIFDVYRCENLVDKPSINVSDSQPNNNNPNAKATGPTSSIEISFAGATVKTSSKKNTCFPIFNEKLTIIDLFPPLCQSVKIELCYTECCRKAVQSTKYINLKSISDDKEEGFLPTFGPTYVHMYFNYNLEGYAGKILMSMTTEIQELTPSDTRKAAGLVQQIPMTISEQFVQYEDVILLGVIFEATAITKKCSDRMLSFRITFGNVVAQKANPAAGETHLLNSTLSLKAKKISKQYYNFPLDHEKPGLVISTKMPECRKRLFNSNILAQIARELKQNLFEIEDIFENHHDKVFTSTVHERLIKLVDYVSSAGRVYIDVTKEYNMAYTTTLDKERKDKCLKEMTNIIEKVKGKFAGGSRKKTFVKLQNICRRLEALIEDVQDCWPDIFIWMVFGNKKVACYQIQAREILHSLIAEEQGQYCGVSRPICFYRNNKNKLGLSCKMEAMLWLGLERHKEACYRTIPEGYVYQKGGTLLSTNLVAEKRNVFSFKAHIYQGRISPGFDKSGLADTFVRVIFTNKQMETNAVQASLSPVWDQTLIFNYVMLYGSKQYVKNNPMNVVVEILDQDECGKTELVGRTLVKPLVMFRDDSYAPPEYPPKLKWIKTFHNQDVLGEILAAFEYLEVPENADPLSSQGGTIIMGIPPEIKPEMVLHKIEVLFWGVRDLKKVHCFPITRPRISVMCEQETLHSDTIENAKKNLNFTNMSKSMTVVIALQREYSPPICLKLFDSRRFGIYAYSGVHISDVSSYIINPISAQERSNQLCGMDYQSNHSLSDASVKSSTECLKSPKLVRFANSKGSKYKESRSRLDKSSSTIKSLDYHWWLPPCLQNIYKKKNATRSKSQSSLETYDLLPQEQAESEDFDWWTKFYASMSPEQGQHSSINVEKSPQSDKYTLKIYDKELELQSEFRHFTDLFKSFEMYKGKRTGDEAVDEENITAVFKGDIKIYRVFPQNTDYVTRRGYNIKGGMFQGYPENLPLRYLLRVYCVRALGLRPKDFNGKSDPYLYLTLNDQVINDKKNVVMRQVNPVFGRCFELKGKFPHDHTLTITVWDYDTASRDDLIGETKIDLENRFYSKHRAFCGIADHYEESGYSAWRGQQKPSLILTELCRKWNIDDPEYGETSVTIGSEKFETQDFIPSGDPSLDKEFLALTALLRWNEMPLVGFPLVPEHVETRSLYNPSKPGIEQGKLQLWIDMFPTADLPPPRKVNITPRIPVSYELRIIIWNTDDVKLEEDDFFMGERKSDIYVKGYLVDSASAQYTDVHYRSLSGEGNFNWRFVFPFSYLSTENKLVIRKKETVFALDETEFKIPCKLVLQVWDNDTFSSDDFIGALNFELSRMPRGARSSKKCTLAILESHAPTINLFKLRRTKGWWPFKAFDPETKKEVLTGKVEAELEIVSAEDAAKSPVGLGRGEPQALPPPQRPDVSFSWFKNPFKAVKYACCKLYRWKILRAILFLLLVVLILVAVYSFPGYTVKRILGAR